MKISQQATTPLPRLAGRFAALLILAGALAASGAQPALAQRDEPRFQNGQRAEEHHDERRAPPRQARQARPDRAYYGYYEAPHYVYAPPPVVYAPPSAFEFIFPLTFR